MKLFVVVFCRLKYSYVVSKETLGTYKNVEDTWSLSKVICVMKRALVGSVSCVAV